MNRAKRVHPMPFSDTASSVSLPPRPMNPKKDLAVYGYGTVAWKDRMEEWRKRQNNKLQMVKHQGDGGGGGHNDDVDDPDMPKVTFLECYGLRDTKHFVVDVAFLVQAKLKPASIFAGTCEYIC